MRIVAHNGARIWGGAERATVMLLRGLEDRGHETLLLCNSPLVAGNAQKLGVKSRICPVGGDIAITHALRLRRVLRQVRPDVLIVGTYKKLFLTSLGARLAGVPRIVARVGLQSDTPRSAKYRYALRKWTDGVVVNASPMAASFVRLPGFGADKVRVIHNGVHIIDRSGSDGAKLRKQLRIPPSAAVIGTVARLARQKRLDRLIEAVAMLPSHVHCLIAGDGTRRRELEHLATRRNVQSRVHFLGHSESVVDVLDALDVFVISSDTEGLSNAMLEAMSFGIPVVSTRVSGSEDALKGDQNGPAGIVTGFSPADLAAVIGDLLQHPERQAALGAAAKQRASTDFSFDTMLDKWEAFLSQSSAEPVPPHSSYATT